jgi:hypothetical protein
MSQTWWRWARLLGGAAILAVLVWRLGTGPFLDGIRTVSWWSLAAAAGIALVTTACCAWRWRLVARGLGDIKTRFSCTNCPVGETVPPLDKYYTRAPDEVDTDWTLADLEKSVTQAEAKNSGKWVELTFHHICTGDATSCPSPAVTPTIYDQFVDWLAAQKAKGAVTVKTVGQVIGGTTQAAHPGPTAPEVAAGVNAVQNPSMETFDTTTGLPACYLAGGYGTNTAAFSTTTNAHTGTSAAQINVTGYSSGDAKLVPALDLGQCAPTVTPGETWNLGEWYESTAVTQFALYYRTADGLWNYWTSSPWFGATSTWTQATWTTPAIPAGARNPGKRRWISSGANSSISSRCLRAAAVTPATTCPSGGPISSNPVLRYKVSPTAASNSAHCR